MFWRPRGCYLCMAEIQVSVLPVEYKHDDLCVWHMDETLAVMRMWGWLNYRVQMVLMVRCESDHTRKYVGAGKRAASITRMPFCLYSAYSPRVPFAVWWMRRTHPSHKSLTLSSCFSEVLIERYSCSSQRWHHQNRNDVCVCVYIY